MNKLTATQRRLLSLLAAVLLAAGLPEATPLAADELSDALAAAEAAVKQADQEDVAADLELDSRAMTHAATLEIARSEQARSRDALQQFAAARQALERAAAELKPEAELTSARQLVEQKLETMRAAVKRLLDDSAAHDKAAYELIEVQDRTQRVGIALRAAERKVLELKLQALEKTKTDTPECAACLEEARLAVAANDALVAWENQLWADEQSFRLQQTVDMTGSAAALGTDLAAAEPDPQRKAALEQYARSEAEHHGKIKETVDRRRAEFEASEATVYPLRTAALGGLTPLAAEDWNYTKARHLMVRAGFGGTPDEVQKLCGMGLYKAVDHFIRFHERAAADAPFDVSQPLLADPFEPKLRNRFVRARASEPRRAAEGAQSRVLRQWWLKRMLVSPRPLEEKLTLFWHGLFASQYSVLRNSYTMYKQNQTFREHASGNYGSLLRAMVHDPAMIHYLDNNQNVKGKPNENLAREILELFSMGVDQGYTEQDIIEAARALTGYTSDEKNRGFRFVHAEHDPSDKTIFGKCGPWTGDDLVRLILDQPATSRFIARRLYEHFACRQPQEETVESLARVLRAYDYELEPMLRNLFLSQEFYSDHVIGCQIKSPIDLVVGTLRDLGLERTTDLAVLDDAVEQMGQQLLEPPDVKGWRYGRSWISSNRMFVRYNTVADLVRTAPQPDGRTGLDVVALLQNAGCQDAAGAVDHLAKICLIKPLSAEKRQALIKYFGTLPAPSEWAGQRDQLNDRMRRVLILMLSMPESQMT